MLPQMGEGGKASCARRARFKLAILKEIYHFGPMASAASPLFSPFELRGIRLLNRLVLSPMVVYYAKDGFSNDLLFSHLSKFVIGGFGLVFTEAAAVEERGRISHGDLGIWKDEHIAPLRRFTDFARAHGALSGLQLAHAGHKGSYQRAYEGYRPLGEKDAQRGDPPFETIAPSPMAYGAGVPAPRAMTLADIAEVREAWRKAAIRGIAAGFDVLEIHGAHGYLIHEFLSPLTNERSDGYGGDLKGRMRFGLEIAESLREVWPDDKPVSFRFSVIDGVDKGWGIQDSIAFVNELKKIGIDLVDCTSGGTAKLTREDALPREPGFHVPLAETLRKETGMATIVVGLITEPAQADAILRDGRADLIAIGRAALDDPNWPLHASLELGSKLDYSAWPPEYGWWLERRAKTAAKIAAKMEVEPKTNKK